jgi:hypothetical protein
VVGGQELAPEWRVWVLENLLRSGSTADITRLLVERGVDRRMATKAVAQLRRSPELAVCAHLLASAGRAEQVVELLLRHRRALEHVPRRPTPGAEVFYDEIFAQQRPMIFPDLVPGWPAFGKWTPAYLREQFGHVEVEVTSGRDADAAYDQNGSKNAIRCLLSAFVDRVTRVEESNDFYMVAQGRNLGRPELAGLFDDVTLPAGWFDEALLNTSSALWFGPKGTVTPLHHDTSSILFCQVYGSKRLQLISPLELSMYGVAQSLYSRANAETRDSLPANVQVLDVTLASGDALFIPAGYWHQVRALDVSISLALNGFRRPNSFDWFRPGELR